MTKEITELKKRIASLEENHDEILKKADQLYDALTNLRYEGKVAFGRNINKVEKMLGFFNDRLVPHMKVEDIIFSFLGTHIPRLEPVLRLLEVEHREIKTNLEVLEFLLKELSEEKLEPKRTQTIEKLRDKGIYFIYLLRNHIQVEDDSIFQTSAQELRAQEQKDLLKKIKECSEGKFLN